MDCSPARDAEVLLWQHGAAIPAIVRIYKNAGDRIVPPHGLSYP